MMISCKKATVLMSLSMERRLSFKEAFLLRLHLLMCKTCVLCFKQIKGLKALLGNYAHAIAISSFPRAGETGLSAESRQRLKAALEKPQPKL